MPQGTERMGIEGAGKPLLQQSEDTRSLPLGLVSDRRQGMGFIRRITKKVLTAPVEIARGVGDAIDETVNGPKKKDKGTS